MWYSIQIWGITQLIGHIFMMQMLSFDFWFWLRILEVISLPNDSRDSFILTKLNTLNPLKECVRVNSNLWYNSLNWSYLYDADAFFQFQGLIRILEVISSPNHSNDSFILINWILYTHGKAVSESIQICGIAHLIGHISMMQMLSFKFGFWFGF